MSRHSITCRANGPDDGGYALVLGVLTFAIVATFSLLTDPISGSTRTSPSLTSVVSPP